MAKQRSKQTRNQSSAATRRKRRSSQQEATPNDEVDAKPEEQVKEESDVPAVDEEEVEDENNNMKKRRKTSLDSSYEYFADEPPPFAVAQPDLPGSSQMSTPPVQEVNTSADPSDEGQEEPLKMKRYTVRPKQSMDAGFFPSWSRRRRLRPQWKEEWRQPISPWDNDNDNAARQWAWPTQAWSYDASVDPYSRARRWTDDLDESNASNARRVKFQQPMRSPSTLKSVVWGNEHWNMDTPRRARMQAQWRPGQNMSNFCPQFHDPSENMWADAELDEEADLDFDIDDIGLF